MAAVSPAFFRLRARRRLTMFRLSQTQGLAKNAGPGRCRGAVAQLGERYNGIVEVVGSIPSSSTKPCPAV